MHWQLRQTHNQQAHVVLQTQNESEARALFEAKKDTLEAGTMQLICDAVVQAEFNALPTPDGYPPPVWQVIWQRRDGTFEVMSTTVREHVARGQYESWVLHPPPAAIMVQLVCRSDVVQRTRFDGC